MPILSPTAVARYIRSKRPGISVEREAAERIAELMKDAVLAIADEALDNGGPECNRVNGGRAWRAIKRVKRALEGKEI